MRRFNPGGLLLLFLAANLPLLALFFKTAHLSSRSFQIFCLCEGLLGALVAAVFPRMRFVLAGFAIAALPRLPSLALQAPLPNVLFPLFYGLAAGHALRMFRQRKSSQDIRRGLILVWIIALAVFASCIRAVLVYYPEFPSEFALNDSIIAGHVSANFAMHLSLDLGLALLGPLCWIIAELLPGLAGEPSAARPERAFSICAGIAIGFAIGLIVLFLQGPVDALRAGVTDHGFEAGRRPGLLSDTGASNVLFPALCAISSLSILSFRFKTGAPGSGQISVYRTAALTAVLVTVTAVFQGKAVFLSILGIALVWRWMILPSMRWPLGWTLAGSAVAALVAAGAIHLRAPAIQERLFAAEFSFHAVLAAFDPVRAMLFDAFLAIFQQSPWTGYALNGFIPRLMLLKAERPELYPENPPGLIPGILTDTGIAGLIFCLAAAAFAAVLLRRVLSNASKSAFAMHLRFLIFLPVSLLPVFLVGYHILFAEISAFCLLPLLFLDSAEHSHHEQD